MKANLFSVRSVAEKGFKQIIIEDKWLFKKNGVLIIEGYRKDDIYLLDVDIITNQEFSFLAQSQSKDSLQIWHERTGHQNKTHVKELVSIKGIKVATSDKREYCDRCTFGKCQHTNFRVIPKATSTGELIVTDVCGPMLGVDTDFL
ncbi:hypothetical protein KM043_017080 [Ampulex compressa]|nr:hypothetical protein KM043_017080 [Ampulex compressa]